MVAPSEDVQPQLITSPNGRLQILHHKMSTSQFGHRIVEGAVKNISSDLKLSAQIRVSYYDAAGTLIDTEVDMVKHLEPGKTGAFEAVYSGPKRGDVKYYKIANLRQV